MKYRPRDTAWEHPCGKRRGVSLLEVVIAIAIVAVASIGMYGSATYTSRQNLDNLEHEYAIQIAESVLAKARVANFDKLGTTSLVAADYEYQFSHPSVLEPDPLKPKMVFNITPRVTGWGVVKDSGDTTLEPDFPSRDDFWISHEWADHFVVVASGLNSNQIMRITNNTRTKLNVDFNLDPDGTANSKWKSGNPDIGSLYFIDNGKTLQVTVEWEARGTSHSLTQQELIPRPMQ